MNFTLLGRLIHAIETSIGAAKKAGKTYCFMEAKRHILNVYKNEVGQSRDAYSSAISSHFGKLGAEKRRRKLKEETLESLISTLEEIKKTMILQDAIDLELQEKMHKGNLEISSDGDIVFLEEDEEN